MFRAARPVQTLFYNALCIECSQGDENTIIWCDFLQCWKTG